MVGESIDVRKMLDGYSWECVEEVVNSLGYLPYFLHKMWGRSVKLAHSSFQVYVIENMYLKSSYYHHQIRSVNLSPALLPLFSVVLCLTLLYHHMLSVSYIYIYIHIYIIHISWESWGLFLLLLCSLLMFDVRKWIRWVHDGLHAVFVCLHISLPHYYHYADVPECIELIKCLLGTRCQVCVWDWFNSLSYL